MQGLELCELFYKEYGEPMLRQFPDLLPYLAAGIMGCGSECLGYDDDISQDHDFEPGFCVFLPGEDLITSQDAFQLERAYAKLPNEFMGYRVNKISKYGVIRIEDFLRQRIGGYPLPPHAGLYIDDQYFLEVTSGKLFMDNLGTLTKIRQDLVYLPEDIRLKKLVGNLILMHQAGQYNYERCISRGETGAAQLSLHEFVKAAMHCFFLLQKRYMPYYKWSFRALRDSGVPENICTGLESLISTGNTEHERMQKLITIRMISDAVVYDLIAQGLSKNPTNYLDVQAQIVNEHIKDHNIRNMHLMCAV